MSQFFFKLKKQLTEQEGETGWETVHLLLRSSMVWPKPRVWTPSRCPHWVVGPMSLGHLGGALPGTWIRSAAARLKTSSHLVCFLEVCPESSRCHPQGILFDSLNTNIHIPKRPSIHWKIPYFFRRRVQNFKQFSKANFRLFWKTVLLPQAVIIKEQKNVTPLTLQVSLQCHFVDSYWQPSNGVL